MARMSYEIILAPEAAEDLDGLKANLRAEVREGIETHLRHEPEKVSRSRIKRKRPANTILTQSFSAALFRAGGR